MNKLNDFITKLNIPQDWNIDFKDDTHVTVTLPDSNSYALVYSKLENVANIDDEMTKLNEHTTSLTYYTDDGIDITMSANFDDDVYTVEVEFSNED